MLIIKYNVYIHMTYTVILDRSEGKKYISQSFSLKNKLGFKLFLFQKWVHLTFTEVSNLNGATLGLNKVLPFVKSWPVLGCLCHKILSSCTFSQTFIISCSEFKTVHYLIKYFKYFSRIWKSKRRGNNIMQNLFTAI